MMRVAFVLALAACGDNAVDAAAAAGITTRVVASLPPDGVTSMDLAALDDTRIALARVDRIEGAFCPDCVGLDPADCPALCERSLVSASVLDLASGALAPARPIATVFPASFDHSVDQVEVVALGGDRVGVAWLDCDNARCNGLFAKRSCSAIYTTLDLATGALGTPVTLYAGWFGDLSLAFDQTTRRLLAVIAKDLVFGGGVFRATFDERAQPVAPWQALGSPAARSPALLASAGRMTVVADDWSPHAPPRSAPCADSCSCLDGGTIDLAAGGLFAFTGDASVQIASGRDARDLYGRREQIAAIDAGGRIVVAATQSIDRNAELFALDAGAWRPLLATPAPIPTWIGALGTADHAAWLGAKPEGEQATVQRLVAGVSDGELALLDDPLDRSVLLVEPVPSAAGVTTNILVQGVFERTGSNLRWARFDVVAVDAVWP